MSEFLVVAEQLLRREQRPMSAREMTDVGLRERLFSDKLAGQTPWQTMKAKLSVEIRRGGTSSTFVRTAPGLFFLRDLIPNQGEVYEAKPWRPPPTTEQVMVFSAAALNDPRLAFQGVTSTFKARYRSLFQTSQCRAMERATAETTEEFKQVLTYVLVTRAGHVLAYQRGVYNRVEEMLKGANCVGFGGHVQEADSTLFSADDLGLREAAARELSEELRLPPEDRFRLDRGDGLQIVGLLNDDSSDVGRRHFAVLMRYEVSSSAAWDEPVRGEKSINRLRWIDPGDPGVGLASFEYWSQLALRHVFPKQAKAQPTYAVRHRAPFRKTHLLALVGPLGSGKTQAARVLTERYGYKEVNSGKVLADNLGIPPVPLTARHEFQAAAGSFISRPDGPETLARAISAAVAESESERVLVDGIRHRTTLRLLKQLEGALPTATVFVQTPADIAFEFYRSREEPGLTIQRFLALRGASAESDVESLIEDSDAVLYNWSGADDYGQAIEKLMADLRIETRPGIESPIGSGTDVASRKELR